MRVLLATDISSHMRGGVPAETRRLCSELVRRGHAVALASDVPLPGSQATAHYPMPLPMQPASVTALRQALEDFKPDVVHVICMSSKGLVMLEPLLNGTHWILTVHSVPPHERKLNRWHSNEALHYGGRFLRYLANAIAWRLVLRRIRPHRIVVHSEFVREIVVRYGFPNDRVAVIPLPFVVDRKPSGSTSAPSAGRTTRLLTIGGIAHTKGQHDVIKALPAIARAIGPVSYQLVGEIRDDSYLRYLNELAASLGVSDAVKITPDLDDPQMHQALDAADVYVQPSHEEGFCLAYAEAAARVSRIVGADTGAIKAINADDLAARTVDPKRPDSIAAAVIGLSTTILPDDHLAMRAERLSQRFSSERYVAEHERLFAREST